MKVNVQKRIGATTFSFVVDEKEDIEALARAGFLSSTPDKCSLCKSTDVTLTANKAKGYTFVKVVCQKCRAVSNLGQYKEGGFFWKDFEKQSFDKREVPGIGKEDLPDKELEDITADDIPI